MKKSSVVRNLSFHDLKSVGYKIDIKYKQGEGKQRKAQATLTKDGSVLTKKELKEVLFTMGLNPSIKGMPIIGPVKHRTLSGVVCYDHYYSCPERFDKEWLSSGNASEEAKMNSSNMLDMGSISKKLSSENEEKY